MVKLRIYEVISVKYYLIIGNAKNGVKIDFSKLKEFKSLDSHK